MIRAAIPLVFALALGTAPAALAADAAPTTTHSGTVAAIDPAGGVLILEEVGPWRVEQGRTVVIERTVALTADTKFNSFIRVNVPGAFAGDFLEVALDADSVTPGDFVTVEGVRERGRLVAVRVTIAEVN
ncbi:MAG TPA: hypothetical protein VGD07_03340 [Methylomirabilota bacterium]